MSIFKRQRGAVLPNGLIVAITTDWDLTEICANGRIQKSVSVAYEVLIQREQAWNVHETHCKCNKNI